jgi:hypothetical membrane protein
MLIPISFVLILTISMNRSPWFTWTNNALSDLGAEGISAAIFNNGLIVVGILFLIFSVGLTKIISEKIGAYLLIVSSISLTFAGVFPESSFVLHYFFSVVFFGSLVIALFVFALTIEKTSFGKNMRNIALGLFFLSIASTAFLFIFKGIAIPESLIIFPTFFWFIGFGIKMTHSSELKENKNRDNAC